jgi:integrase
VASAWLSIYTAKDGSKRYRVHYRTGGRESAGHYAGSFNRKRDALLRQAWVEGELAAMRVPDLRVIQAETRTPTLAEAAKVWSASRIDVVEGTQNVLRSAFNRIDKLAPSLMRRRLDEVSVDELNELVETLHAAGYKRGTIKKTTGTIAQLLDHHRIEPNPARDRRVRLPRERKAHVPPPLAEHVERVAEALPRHYVLPFLTIDECGPRVNELATAQVGDLDEHRRAIRIRWTVEKNDRYRHLELPDDLFAAIVATLPAREDRDPEARLFPELDEAALRTAITRACKATGVPHFSPHGLRRRRGSLYYKRTGSLAEVAELLGDSNRVAADHYVYALTDYREVDRSIALARVVT